MTESNIWLEAQKNARNNVQKVSKSENKTLLVIGSKSSGKSTIVLKFLDRKEIPKPTLGLEFLYGRKSTNSLDKVFIFKYPLFTFRFIKTYYGRQYITSLDNVTILSAIFFLNGSNLLLAHFFYSLGRPLVQIFMSDLTNG